MCWQLGAALRLSHCSVAWEGGAASQKTGHLLKLKLGSPRLSPAQHHSPAHHSPAAEIRWPLWKRPNKATLLAFGPKKMLALSCHIWRSAPRLRLSPLGRRNGNNATYRPPRNGQVPAQPNSTQTQPPTIQLGGLTARRPDLLSPGGDTRIRPAALAVPPAAC